MAHSVDPSRDPPTVIVFARAVITQAATSHLECSLATSLKMGGGLKKTQFVAAAVLLFKERVSTASPSDAVHPLLAPLIKTVASAGSSNKVK